MPPSYELVYINQSTGNIYISCCINMHLYIYTLYIYTHYISNFILYMYIITINQLYTIIIILQYMCIYTYIYIMYLHVYPLYTQRSLVISIKSFGGSVHQGALAWRPSSAAGLHLNGDHR